MSSYITIGNFSGYLPELFKMDKQAFIDAYKWKVNRDINTVWEIIQERGKAAGYENAKEDINVTKEVKKPKRNRSNEIPVYKSGVSKTDN